MGQLGNMGQPILVRLVMVVVFTVYGVHLAKCFLYFSNFTCEEAEVLSRTRIATQAFLSSWPISLCDVISESASEPALVYIFA